MLPDVLRSDPSTPGTLDLRLGHSHTSSAKARFIDAVAIAALGESAIHNKGGNSLDPVSFGPFRRRAVAHVHDFNFT